MVTESESSPVGIDFSKRIDNLLASAIEDQAREQKMLLDVVQGAETELAALRKLVETRDQSVIDAVEARLSGVASEQTMEHVANVVERLVESSDFREATLPVEQRLEVVVEGLEMLGGRIEAIKKALERLDPWKPALEIQRSVAMKLSEIAGEIRDHVAEQASKVSTSIESTGSTLAEDASGTRERLSQQLSEAASAISKDVKGVSAGWGERIDAATSIVTSHVAEKTGEVAGRVRAAEASTLSRIDEKTAGLGEQIERSSSAVTSQVADQSEALSAQVSAASASLTSRLEERTQSLADKTDRSTAYISSQIEDRVGEVSTTVGQTERTLSKEITGRVEALSAELARSSSALSSEIDQKVSSLSAKVVSSNEGLKEEMAVATEGIREQAVRGAKAAEEAKESIDSLRPDMQRILQTADARSFDRLLKISAEVEKMSEGLGSLNEHLDQRMDQDVIEEQQRASAMSRQIQDFRRSLEGRTAGVEEKLDAKTEKLSRELFEHMEAFHRTLTDQTDRAVTMVQAGTDPIAERLEDITERVKDTNRRTTDSNTRLESLYESLLAYIVQRDQHLEETRDRVLVDLIDQLGDTLKRRDRARIAEGLRSANEARRDRKDATAYRKMKAAKKALPPREALVQVSEEVVATPPEQAPVAQPSQPVMEPTVDALDADLPAEVEVASGSSLPEDEEEWPEPVVLRAESPKPAVKPKPKASSKTTQGKSKPKTASSNNKSKSAASKSKPAGRPRTRKRTS